MDEERVTLIREALEGGGPDASEEDYEALKERVLQLKLSPEATMARADELGSSGSAMDRAIFREWMRVQAAAEQGHRFESAPATQALRKEGE